MNNYFISKKLLLLFSLLCFNGNNLYIKSLIVIPFTYINNKFNISSKDANTPEEYFQYYLKGSIYTTINVNNKPLKFHLTLDRYTTYISNKTLSEIAPKSAEIQKNEDLYSLEYIGILRAKYTNISFTFLSNDSKNISINNYSFFMATRLTDDFESVKIREYYAMDNEEIGFNIWKGSKNKIVEVEPEEIDPYDYDDDEDEEPTGEKYVYKNNGYLLEENTNIITQLKKQNLITSYDFMIKMDDEGGKIIIGGIPHEYDPKHYSQKYLIELKSSMSIGFGSWDIIFDNILYNDQNYSSIKSAELNLDLGFIISTEYFLEFLNKSFFNIFPYNNSCFEKKVDNYFIKYCEEGVIKNFKKIIFTIMNKVTSNNQRLEFDYKDLFVKAPGNNNLYYFQIVFQSGSFKWKLGHPFFKKYPAIFNQDKKTLGFYLETGEYKIDNNNKNKNSDGKEINFTLYFAWILVIILAICLIGLIITFYKVLPYIKRKKKANEMDDDFDYTGQDYINNKIN